VGLGEQGILGIGNNSSGHSALNFALLSGKVSFWYSGNAIIQGTTLVNNTWYHICGVVASGLGITIYNRQN
jgi:hypothetical protein